MAKRRTRTRANGEGSVYWIKREGRDPKAAFAIVLDQPNGTKKRKVFTFDTEAEARAKRVEILRTLHTGGTVSTTKDTVGAYLDRWLEHLREEGRLRPRTLFSYDQHVRLYIKPTLGNVKLAKLSAEQVQRWINARKAAGRPEAGRGSRGSAGKDGRVSGVTMRYSHAVLRKALAQAVRWRLIPTNVASKEHVDGPRVERSRADAFTVDEARALLGAAVGHPHEAAFACMISMGLRPAEALGLVWWDPKRPERGGVDLDAGHVYVRGSLAEDRKTKSFSLAPPKTEKSRRDLPIPPPTLEALRRRRAAQNEEKMRNRRDWKEPIRGLVFTTSTGEPIRQDAFRAAFRALAREAGVRELRPYDLRHSAATLNLGMGISLVETAKMLGHSTIRLTGDTYSHVTNAMQEEAAAKMGALLAPRNA
ncbi:MAG TPA: site-specific integrase [Vulgatibacter sp.]|nr:site-specific integrase [Vulgatibacter sp.]